MNYRSMKRLFRVVPLVALFASTIAPAASASSLGARKDLEAIYARYVQLVRQNDREGLKQFLKQYTTPDFVQKLPGGKSLNRSQTIATLMEGPLSTARFTEEKLDIVSVKVKGNLALILFNDRTTAVFKDVDGKSHKIVTASTSRDTWIRTPAGWRNRLSEILKSDARMDGKGRPL